MGLVVSSIGKTNIGPGNVVQDKLPKKDVEKNVIFVVVLEQDNNS